MSSAPLSVVLPADLRARLEEEARKRHVKLSTVVRVLAAERVQELDAAAELSASDRWQRDQAWATWERLRAGDRREVSRDELEADVVRAKRRAARRRP